VEAFLWALWLKKNLIAKILWTDGESRRERAKAEEFLRF
jgi:hypothetical protein